MNNMLKKIIKIKGIGKFSDFSAIGNIELKKINIIYGENSKGKTTLTSILRSLKKGDPSITSQRKTLGLLCNQEVELRFENETSPVRLGHDGWNRTKKYLEVFDINFIDDNVYSGLEIGAGHKKCLHNFILGEDQILLKDTVNDLKTKIDQEMEELRLLNSQIDPNLKGLISLEDFMNLKEDKSLDRGIELKEKAILVHEENKQIKDQQELELVQPLLLPVDLDDIDTILSKSINSIKAEFIKKVLEHEKKLSIDDCEEWLRKGFTGIQDNKCPFCLQGLDKARDIIDAYSQFFNNEYTSFKKKISGALFDLKSINFDALFTQKELICAKNAGKNDFWKKYLGLDTPQNILEKDTSPFKQQIKRLIAAMQKKSEKPMEKLQTDVAKAIRVALRETNEKISKMDGEIRVYNDKIRGLKNAPIGDLDKLKGELLVLTLKRDRFGKFENVCRQIAYKKGVIKALNIEKKTRQDELERSIEATFEKYQKTINKHLKDFGVEPIIENFSGGNYRGTGKDPFVDFTFTLNGSEIPFEGDGTNPCIKTTLGESDKASIAFAFFLSKLEVDGHIGDKIIIFDDPLSSFDENRKSRTLSELKRLSADVKQIIVLTHNPLVARDFWMLLRDDDCQSLQIARSGNTSVLTPWDIEHETSGFYYQYYVKLDKFLSEGASEQGELVSIAQLLRPTLESYLRIKFPNRFKPKEWLGDYIRIIKEAADEDPLVNLKEDIAEIDSINDYAAKYHHDERPIPPVQEEELKNMVKKLFSFIRK